MTLLDHEPQRKRLCVYLLGQFEVVVDGRAVPDDAWRHGRAARLVKVLALAPHHRLHREQVMDLLWPDSEPARAANNLHQALHIARQILDPDRSRETELVRLQSELVSLAADSEIWVDVDLFEAAAARAIADKDLVGLQAAARMYTGDLLPDDPYHEWTLDRRAALKSIYLRLNAEIVSLAAAAGDLGSAVRSCEEIVRLDATREDAHTQLMHLYSLSGRRHEALRQYETLEQVLRDELGLEPEPASRRLYGAILNGTFPGTAAGTHQQLTPDLDEPQPSPTPPPGNLPQQVNRFVGRAQDIADLRHTMGNAHLVTLTGTGGCGKTRLAIQLAHEVKDHSSIGAWMVELAGLRDPLLVPQAVASALGVTERPDQPLIETLADHLGSRDVLLVLDNCEHLIGAAAALTDRLLAACPLLRVLATSREPLHIPGEVVWRVSSLGVPDPKHVPNIPTLRRIEAVELFLDRAQAALPGFEMSAANAGAIARICHRLDGIPLALELAAARVGALSVEHILERLDDCFTVLKGGSRTALSRQQTLKALLDWSHDLLAEQERALFRRLAVFTGGFSFTAAEAVGGGGVLDALTGLIDKSLVQVDRQEEEVRYRVLEPVRQYANLHLVASGECATNQSAHAEWYTDFARRADSELWGKDHRQSIEELEKEHDNLRAALGRCAQGELEAALGLALVDRLWQFWLLGGYLTEGRRWLDALLAQNPPGSTHKAAALLHASNLALRQGDYGRKVEELIKESSTIYQMCNDDAGRCRTMRTLGTQSYINGDYASAGRYFRECERLAALSGQEGERALAVHELGIVAWARSAYGEARLLLEEARTLFAFMATAVTLSAPFLNVPMTEAPYAEDSDVLTIQEETWAMLRRLTPPAAAALSLVHIATVARQMGANEEAHQFLLQSIELFHLNGDMEGLSQALAQWGNLYRAEGNYDRARDCLYQSLELRRELGDRRGVGRSLNNLGVVALYAGNPQRAYAFFAESMNLFESMNDLPGIAATLENQGHEALFLERWNEAKRAYERSVTLAHEMGGVKRERAFDLRHIGLAARGDGDESSAIAAFRASRSLFAEMGDQRSAQIADRLLGNVEAPGTTLQSCR